VYALKPLISPVGDHAPHSYKSLLEYLDSQAPELSELVKNAKLPERNRKSVARLFGALLAHPEGFSYARQQVACVERALEIGASSDYLTGLLVHHPEDISALDHQEAMPPAARDQEEMNIGLERRGIMEPFAWVSEGTFDVREKMALLRRNFRATVLELGSADLRSLNDIYPCLEHWTELAGRSVASALWIGHQAQEGSAQAESAGMRELPFVILGLGRLGLSEFDLASDADLMFVAPADTPREEIAQWMRLAEKAIEVLFKLHARRNAFCCGHSPAPPRAGGRTGPNAYLAAGLRQGICPGVGSTDLPEGLPSGGERGTRLPAGRRPGDGGYGSLSELSRP